MSALEGIGLAYAIEFALIGVALATWGVVLRRKRKS